MPSISPSQLFAYIIIGIVTLASAVVVAFFYITGGPNAAIPPFLSGILMGALIGAAHIAGFQFGATTGGGNGVAPSVPPTVVIGPVASPAAPGAVSQPQPVEVGQHPDGTPISAI